MTRLQTEQAIEHIGAYVLFGHEVSHEMHESKGAKCPFCEFIKTMADYIENREKRVVKEAETLMGEAVIERHRQCNYQWEKTESFIQTYSDQKSDDVHGVFARLKRKR